MTGKAVLQNSSWVVLVTFLFPCMAVADAAEPLVPDDEAAATPAAGFGAAFGRIHMVEDGKEKELSGLIGILRPPPVVAIPE